MTPQQFAEFDEPGWGRIAVNFSLRHYGAPRTLISYEACTATGDPDAARRFARYWMIVRPFARRIMRATLDTLRQSAVTRSLNRGVFPRAARQHLSRWDEIGEDR